MIISESMQRVIRVLANRKEIKLRELAKEAAVSLGIAVRLTNDLEKTGYIEKKVKIRVKNAKRLVKCWSFAVSIDELEKIEFTAAERPLYVMKKMANIADKNKLKYAFTLFSATEIVSPYVSPQITHLYILKEEEEKWKEILPKENIFPAEKGNIVCFLVDNSYFYSAKNIRGINVVSLPQLYADLFSYKGRGEEAAEQILKVI